MKIRSKSILALGVVSLIGCIQTTQAALINYDVIETFREPDTQPRDTIFTGSYTFDTDTGAVSNLQGNLTQSMTGTASGSPPYYDMSQVHLTHQLSSEPVTIDGVDGLLVTTFLNDNTNTFSTNPAFGGTDGWEPGSGTALYYDFPGSNPGNAYATIFVNTEDPTATLMQAQIDMLAYADCTPGGMMAATCMTGTTEAGYGTIGSMSGYPVSQITTQVSAPAPAPAPVPLPGGYILMLSALGMISFFRRKEGEGSAKPCALPLRA
jgi:hypothetical protein